MTEYQEIEFIIEEDQNDLNMYSYISNNICIEYFVGYEIAALLGYKNPSQAILTSVSKSNQLEFRDYPGVKEPALNPKTILISSDGVSEILKKTRKHVSDEVLNILKKFNIDTTKLKKDEPTLSNEIKTNDREEDDEKDLVMYSYISNYLCFEYFVGYEIAALLGYKNPINIITTSVSKCNQLQFRDYPGVKEPKLDPRTVLITSDGAIEILLKTRKRISPDVLHILKKFNIDTTNRKCLTKEQQTLSTITDVFKTEKFEDQFKIGPYYLDLYFSEHKIVIECDENGHADRKPYKEEERMEYVNFELDIDDSSWIRFNPDAPDFDISKVIGQIYRKIDEIKESKNNKNHIGISDISKIFEKDNPILDYEIDKYKVDLYFPIQKIIFEFYKNDTSRKNYINTFLGINETNWIIFNPDDETFDISKVIGQLYILMKEKEVYLKMCSSCRKDKISTEFHKNKNTPDGLSLRCRECRTNITVNNKKTIPKVETPDKKNCPQCETEKLSSEFWKNTNRKDGLDSVCICCRKEDEQKIINSDKIVEETKICSKCKETKNTTEDFGKRKKSSDGYKGVCKECDKNTYKVRFDKSKNETKIIEEFKKCIICDEIKNTKTSFFKATKNKDGYLSVCKVCSNKKESVQNARMKKKAETQANKKKYTEFKNCSKCKILKNTDTDFQTRKDSFDGRTGVCKECINERKSKKKTNDLSI